MNERHPLDRRQALDRHRPSAAATCSTRRPARSAAQVDLAVAGRRRRRRRRRRGGLSRHGGTPRWPSARTVLFALPRAGARAPRRAGRGSSRAEHGKVLSDALGEVARGLEVVEFACGIPHLLKGGFSENVSTGVDVVLDPPAARRRRRHHAVQLPGDGADVDVPGRDRVRQRLRAQASGEGPVGRRCCSPSCWPRPGCPTASSTSCTATRRRSTRCSTHPDVAAVSLRRLDADRPLRLRDRHRARQAGAGARRRQEPHGRAARRRPRPGRRRRGQRRVRLGRRALHGDLGRGRRRTRSATSWSPRSRERMAALTHRRRPTTRLARWARSSPARTATRSRRYLDAGRRPRARRSSSTAAAVAADGAEDGFWLGPTLFDHVTPEMSVYTRRDLRPGAVASCGSTPTTRRVALINDNPYGNGAAIFTNDGGAARRFQNEVEVGMVGINVPIPVPMAYYSLRRLEGLAVRRHPRARHRGRALLHPRQGRHLPLARPEHGGVNLGFPHQRLNTGASWPHPVRSGVRPRS